MPKKRLLVFMGATMRAKNRFRQGFLEPFSASARYSAAGVMAVTGASSPAR
jgi:hypothetical protein